MAVFVYDMNSYMINNLNKDTVSIYQYHSLFLFLVANYGIYWKLSSIIFGSALYKTLCLFYVSTSPWIAGEAVEIK